VVLEQERVAAMSPLARAAGVRAGMRRGGALMLAPDAQVHEREPQREAEALNAVALAMLQFTPQVAEAEEATLLLDVGASLRLFGGIRALCWQIQVSLRTLGFSGVISCAPTARGAWLLARGGAARAAAAGARQHAAQVVRSAHSHRAEQADRSAHSDRAARPGDIARRSDAEPPAYAVRVLSLASLEYSLAGLPCGLLQPLRPYLDWLEGIGCQTLGELRRLPRPGLQRRCGRAVLDMLDAAHGLLPELFEWLEAPPTFRAKLELFDRVEHADALLHGAQRLILQMTGWLCARQFAVERIHLLLEHERGREARPPTAIEIILAEPTWRDEHLLRLLKERLAKLTLEAPVIGLTLEALQVHPMLPPSESLFPDPGGSKEDRQRLMELLVARLGAENVLQAAPLADYRPEHANRWVSVQEKVRPSDARAQLPPDMPSLPRPSWLLAKPIALLMRDHRPFYGSPLKLMSTAERIEAGWWGEAETRDYFIAQGEDHTHYWIYRERPRNGDGEAEQRWYLHGLFG